MRVISNQALANFAAIHFDANAPMQTGRRTIESRAFANFADLKTAFHATDKVGN